MSERPCCRCPLCRIDGTYLLVSRFTRTELYRAFVSRHGACLPFQTFRPCSRTFAHRRRSTKPTTSSAIYWRQVLHHQDSSKPFRPRIRTGNPSHLAPGHGTPALTPFGRCHPRSLRSLLQVLVPTNLECDRLTSHLQSLAP